MPQIIDQFGHKMCQKKRKDVDYKLLQDFFKNIFLYMHCRLSKIRSVQTYVIPWTVYFGWIWSRMNGKKQVLIDRLISWIIFDKLCFKSYLKEMKNKIFIHDHILNVLTKLLKYVSNWLTSVLDMYTKKIVQQNRHKCNSS